MIEGCDPSSSSGTESLAAMRSGAGIADKISRRRSDHALFTPEAISPVTKTIASLLSLSFREAPSPNHCAHAISIKLSGKPDSVTCLWLLIENPAVLSPLAVLKEITRSSANQPLSLACQSMRRTFPKSEPRLLVPLRRSSKHLAATWSSYRNPAPPVSSTGAFFFVIFHTLIFIIWRVLWYRWDR